MGGGLVFGETNVEQIEMFVTTTDFKKVLVKHLPKKKKEFCKLFDDLLVNALEKELLENPELNGDKELQHNENGVYTVGVSKISQQVKLDREKFKKNNGVLNSQKEPLVEIKMANDIKMAEEIIPIPEPVA